MYTRLKISDVVYVSLVSLVFVGAPVLVNGKRCHFCFAFLLRLLLTLCARLFQPFREPGRNE